MYANKKEKKKKIALGLMRRKNWSRRKECKITKQSQSQVCSGGYVTSA
jgi:hypothetical protein